MVLPSTLKEMSPDMLNGCYVLKTVRVARGCPVDVEKFVDSKVKVLRE